ncbi:MAG: restriction endonuclease subunit S [bacterium]|nr:restriction endonuclease subunit S [bacterium]
MIADLGPYPAYRDSGVAWLGKVPENWEIKRGKNLLCCIDVRSATGTEELLTVSSKRGVVPRRSATVTMFKAESYVGHKLCWPGDLVINSLWAWARGLGVSQIHGIISTAYGVYRARPGAELAPEFIHRLVRSTPFHWELQVRSKGVWTSRLQLTDESFLGAPFPVPPLPEQAAIVRFLDYVDRRIRRYIRAKQKLIELLEEQKQAIIHRAVTRGLDPDVRLEPSGVEWLGEVPEHWEVWQIGHFARVGNGSTPSRGNTAYWSGGSYPWLNSSYANQETIREADQFVTELALRECHLPIVPAGSVLVAITGQGKTRGKAALLQFEATINQHVAFITIRNAVCSAEYLRLALAGLYSQLRAMSDDSGSTKGALTCADLRHFRVALPPNAEQAELLAAVDHQTRNCATAIEHTQQEIDLLREYRTRLIADVVTGKLDVREAASGLPEEVEEPVERDGQSAARRAIAAADRLWDERGLTNEDMDAWLHE